MTGTPNSAIYVGHLRHRRYRPLPHAFRYRLFMTYLDLDELPRLSAHCLRRYAQLRVITFRRADYLGDPEVPLADCVRALVRQRTGRQPRGPIRLLTHLRQFGYCFNPVSFYYCFDLSERVEAIVAEVTNTPWNERHAYVLDVAQNLGSATKQRYCFRKTFHVSPFMEMECDYDWRLNVPASALVVHMENHDALGRMFDATLTLRRLELTVRALARMLVEYPFMTATVAGRIYLQAARLWLKGTPFVPHPPSR